MIVKKDLISPSSLDAEIISAVKKPNSRIDLAIEFATKAHEGQSQKGTERPYINHPLEVGALLVDAGCDEDTVIAGYLHDVAEDSEFSLDDIAKRFGFRIAGIVEGCSEDKSLSWEERKAHTIEYLKTAPAEVKFVSCADKLSNIRSIKRDYAQEGEGLWSRFNKGRERQEYYYRGVVTSLGKDKFKKHPLYEALASEVDIFFSNQTKTVDQEFDEMFEFDEEREFLLHHGPGAPKK